MGKLRLLLVASVLALGAACAAIESAPPNERIAAGVTAVTVTRTTTDQLLLAHKVTPAEATQLNAQADAIVVILQALRSAPTGTDTTSRINAALALLTALQGYLATKGGAA